jgi:hypothetical protein
MDDSPSLDVTPTLDADALRTLAEGGSVVLLAHGQKLPTARSIKWQSTYWTGAWGWGSGLGLMCKPSHPALSGFPCQEHADWQWRELTDGGECLQLPADVLEEGMIVEHIADFHAPAREACIFEARVGQGRLLVCLLDLTSNLRQRHAARALRDGLLAYADSAAFDPASQISEKVARELLLAAHDD